CVYPAGIATRIAKDAHMGAATRSTDFQQVQERARKALRIPPEKAAAVIIRGVLRNKDRVLIGKDAYGIDLLQRLFPTLATAILSAWVQKQIASEKPAPTSASR